MSVPAFADFTYPGEDHPRGVVDFDLHTAIASEIERRGKAIMARLGPRIGDCMVACTAWHAALSSELPIMVGGFGEHIETVPETPADRRSGYLTDDDGVVTHWWLMFGPRGSLFDPTAHQFDGRGGVSKDRYLVDGKTILQWSWADLVLRFPSAPPLAPEVHDLLKRVRRSP